MAQTLKIAPAVEVTFDTQTNHFYQVEAASTMAPDQWTPVGPTHWGRGTPISQAIGSSDSTQFFFRTREIDLTNRLHNAFALDGNTLENDDNGSIHPRYYIASRFGTPNHAARSAAMLFDGSAVYAHLVKFAQNDFTISLWVMGEFDAPSSLNFGNIMGVPGGGLSLIGTNGTIQLILRSGMAPIVTSPPVTWKNGQWYCIQLVFGNGIYSVYRDLEAMGRSAPMATMSSADYFDLYLGPARGGVDEVRFYRRALSVEEIGGLFRLAEH